MDSTECENITSAFSVQKLNLPTTSHPSPYKLIWFSKTSTIVISHKSLVIFIIGNFQDTVQCDVVGMDACHV